MDDLQYLPRQAASLVARALEVSPVVVVMGARQTGKSTMARAEPALSQNRLYLTLDDLSVLERAKESPGELVRSASRLTLDEVQREPELLLAIKEAVDRDTPRVPGRFLVTGSTDLLLSEKIGESLAGRATYVPLWPLTVRERRGEPRAGIWSELVEHPRDRWIEILQSVEPLEGDWGDEVRRGGYPTPSLSLASDDARQIWMDGYVRTYLERDLQSLAAIQNLVDYRRFMRAAALRIGNLVNLAEIGRDTSIPRSTVHRYLNLLEASYQAVRVEPYSVNRTRRLVKSPKLYWSDPALALFLSGGTPTGAHLENLVLADLLSWRDAQIPRPEVLYWRTSTGQEVDFVVEHSQGLLAVEVKAGRQPRSADLRGLRSFRDDYRDSFLGAVLLHDGEDVQWLGDGILGAPWRRVL